jgi:large subunit ribosomal protein L13
MTTAFPKAGQTVGQWYLINLEGKILGRAATRVASILKGKHRPEYAPHCGLGDHVVVINAGKVRLTGKKLDQKVDFRHSGWPRGDKYTSYRDLIANKPEHAFWLAVKGMLPKNSLGRDLIKNLIIYKGAEHQQAAQKPQALEI